MRNLGRVRVMNPEIQVAKTLVKGALVGLNSYIKPGGLHRLAPGKLFDEVHCNLVVSIDHVAEAVTVGESARKGEIIATTVDYGKMFSGALKESFRSCGAVHPQYVVPLLVVGFSIGLSGVESILEESAKFKKALEIVNSTNRWSDLKQFIELLRIVGRNDMFEHLQAQGYTQLALLKSGITLNEVLRTLSSQWRGFSIIDSREGSLFGYLKKIDDLYKEYKELDTACVALYMDLIKPHVPQVFQDKLQSAEACKYMGTPECAKLMYELDVLFRKNKLNYYWASEIVTLTSALGSFEGLK